MISESIILPFLPLILVVLIFILMASGNDAHHKMRGDSFREIVEQMNYEYFYTRRIPMDIRSILPEVFLGEVNHFVQGSEDDLHFMLFESRAPHQGTLITSDTMIFALDLEQSQIDLPSFMLRPHQVTDDFKQILGYQTVLIPEPFNEHFTLINFDNEKYWAVALQKIPTTFYTTLAANTYLISNGRWLLYFKADQRISPTERTLRYFTREGIDTFLTLHDNLYRI